MTDKIQTIKIGFVPLVDCALLAIAKEKGFAEENGVDLSLHKEVSWANVRDKLYLGYLDGAQMLAPMSIAANLGSMPNSKAIVAPFVLGRNGNAITVSNHLFGLLQEEEPDLLGQLDLKKTGAALKAVIEKRKKAGLELLRFGMVFPFSCHNYHLRYWMAACGIDPDQDVHLEVIPPPFMDQYLGEGRIDGFCVGEPWNSLAVAQDIGVIVGATSQIWPQCPEKLLGLRETWVDENAASLGGLMKALHQAAVWAGDTGNFPVIAQILSRHEYLDVPAEIIVGSLSGDLRLHHEKDRVYIPDFLILSGENANRPSAIGAEWLFDQMTRWSHTANIAPAPEMIARSFCSVIYDELLSAGGAVTPEPEMNFFDSDQKIVIK
ncbi:CmpA/NrtA family ABC transporter substrate-binding protein [Terasakiella sp. A23]|uniref:CmpA/NrtA family ABC transporter substrate-binding protein n=1 Tax=Terasakiella sp. FCG-A23 TaxID=3080561 RepID=UPI002954DCFC|nr:CmpA/NrtA family ABC transporter substrate-binding protein [Terasakiella sp. A23]MDV7341093.1 CmpA/NrtA family ABC transporter substrate-binding protein [Terasakiella sp. A23]